MQQTITSQSIAYLIASGDRHFTWADTYRLSSLDKLIPDVESQHETLTIFFASAHVVRFSAFSSSSLRFAQDSSMRSLRTWTCGELDGHIDYVQEEKSGWVKGGDLISVSTT